MFKFKGKSPGNLDLAFSTLSDFDVKIKTLLMIEVGLEFNKLELAYDIVLAKLFDDKESLPAYVSHTELLQVIDKMLYLCSSSILVDDFAT